MRRLGAAAGLLAGVFLNWAGAPLGAASIGVGLAGLMPESPRAPLASARQFPKSQPHQQERRPDLI